MKAASFKLFFCQVAFKTRNLLVTLMSGSAAQAEPSLIWDHLVVDSLKMA